MSHASLCFGSVKMIMQDLGSFCYAGKLLSSISFCMPKTPQCKLLGHHELLFNLHFEDILVALGAYV